MSKKTVLKVDEVRSGELSLNTARTSVLKKDSILDSALLESTHGNDTLIISQKGSGGGLRIDTTNGVNGGVSEVKFYLDAAGDVSISSLATDGIVFSNASGVLSTTAPTNLSISPSSIGFGSIALLDESAKADLVDGKVPTSQLPDLAISEYLGDAADEAELLTFVGQKGDWATRSDTQSNWIIIANDGSSIGDWKQLIYPQGVSSFNGQTGAIVVEIPTKISDLQDDINLVTESSIAELTSKIDDLEALTLSAL